MHVLHSLSLSALLLAASVPAFAATAGDAAQAIPAPAAPAIQVAPAVPGASSVTPIAPIESAALPAAPAAAATPALPALPAGSAALGSLINPQTLALIDQLSALQVTPQQAAGGVGALLGLAQSQLAGDQYAQLAGAVPGLQGLAGNAGSADNGGGGLLGRLGALSGLLGGTATPAQPGSAPVDSLAGVAKTFSVLGMDTSLVGQFGQILLQFLGNQGVAGALLQSLGGIWGVPGGLAPAPVSGVSAPAAASAGS
ncbi:DUF2780 domain-containing protein [Geopseudomonas aromaticivorans]